MKWLTLFTSLTLASTAAYFSIVGLMTIFSGAAIGIAIMATVLEFSKLVSAAWLHYEWDRINNLVRGYFTAAVLVLMLITSMGIFGFLSKAHIDSALVGDSYSLEASIIDTRIQAEQSKLKAAQDARFRRRPTAAQHTAGRGADAAPWFRNRSQRSDQDPDRQAGHFDKLYLSCLPL